MDKLNAFFKLIYDPNENPHLTRLASGRYVSCYCEGNDIYIGTCTKNSPMSDYFLIRRQEDGTVAFPEDERYADYVKGWEAYIDELINKLPATKKKLVLDMIG